MMGQGKESINIAKNIKKAIHDVVARASTPDTTFIRRK